MVKLKYEFKSGRFCRVWKVFYNNTLLLQTSDKAQAVNCYKRYLKKPPVFKKLDEIIF